MFKVSIRLSAVGVSLWNDPGLGRQRGDGDQDGEDGKDEHGWSVLLFSEDGSANLPYIDAHCPGRGC